MSFVLYNEKQYFHFKKNTKYDPWWISWIPAITWLLIYKYRKGPWQIIDINIAKMIARSVYNQPVDLSSVILKRKYIGVESFECTIDIFFDSIKYWKSLKNKPLIGQYPISTCCHICRRPAVIRCYCRDRKYVCIKHLIKFDTGSKNSLGDPVMLLRCKNCFPIVQENKKIKL